MNKLEQLISELCPDGVEYKKIKDCFKRLKGTPITAGKMKEIETENGEIRVFAGGKTVINAKEEDIPNSNITRVPAVLVQSRGVIDVVYFENAFTFKNEMWAYTHEEKSTVKYLYYVLKNNIQSFRDAASGMGSLPQISLTVTEDFIIPLPPLPVQEEIVRILDNFTELTAELTAELTDRKKQYEHYRDSLLTFDDGVEFAPLSSVSDVIDSLHQTPTYSKSGFSMIRVTDIKGGFIDIDNTLKVDRQTYDIFTKNYAPKKGDIVMSRVGSYGNVGIVPQNNCTCMGQNTVVISSKINVVFLYQYLSSLHVQNYIEKNVSGGSQKTLSLKSIKAIPIPLLDDKTQVYIGDIINKFDTLCNNISSGLPAEIEARKKQYEYYRDKLLTFKNVNEEV